MNQQPINPSTPIDDAAAEHLVDAYDATTSSNPEAKAAGMMEDDFLLRAYQRTDGAPGNPEADALLAEIQRRELDV